MKAGGAPTAIGEARVVECREEWNAIVLGMPHPDFRQSWQWGALRASRGWTVLRVAVGTGHQWESAAQILGRRVPGLGLVLYAPRGPLVADGDAGGTSLPRLLRRIQADTGAIFLRASPAAPAGDTAALAPLEGHGFVRLPDLWSLWNTPRNVMRLDLTGSERDLLGRMTRKRRQHISTGRRKGVSVEVETSLAALRTFHELHGLHGRREGYPVPPWTALEALHREFARDDGLAIVRGFVHGELASMLVGLRFGPVAHTLYAAGTAAARRAPVGDLLHWELMRWARAAGCRELDLGSSCTDVPPTATHPNYGIYRFKRELGARLELCAGYYDLVFARLRYRVARRLERSALRVGQKTLRRWHVAELGGDHAAGRAAPVAHAS
jgi:lipid II:glycine glycyltransferase (peptidoglycan interpeptide bridge formation enzyme)